MMPPLPYKPDDFAKLASPNSLPPVIPSVEPIPAPPNTGSGKNSNTIVYVVLGICAIGGTILVIRLITENSALKYELQESTGKLQTLSILYQQELSKNNLLTNLKSQEDGTTT